MADEEKSQPRFPSQLIEQIQDNCLNTDIKRSGRFIENQEPWIGRDGTRDANPGALAA